jgi:hypothetical protein
MVSDVGFRSDGDRAAEVVRQRQERRPTPGPGRQAHRRWCDPRHRPRRVRRRQGPARTRLRP